MNILTEEQLKKIRGLRPISASVNTGIIRAYETEAIHIYLLMVTEETATPLVEPETVIVVCVPLKVGVPMLVIAVAVVGVPKPVRTEEPVPCAESEPVATVFAVPSVKPITTVETSSSPLFIPAM